MYRKSYRVLALVFVLALAFGTFAALAPATAEASGMGGHHAKPVKSNPNFSQDQLPNPFVRDFDGDCVWWKYELKNGHYVRTYCPCRYGDQEVSYRRDVRAMWADYTYVPLGPAD